MLTIAPEVNLYLKKTIIAVLGTISENGRPHLVPMWFNWEDGKAYMFTTRTTTKWRNIEARPYGSLCVDLKTPPYSAVMLSGTIKVAEKSVYEVVKSCAFRYYEEERARQFVNRYEDNPPKSVAFQLIPETISIFNALT